MGRSVVGMKRSGSGGARYVELPHKPQIANPSNCCATIPHTKLAQRVAGRYTCKSGVLIPSAGRMPSGVHNLAAMRSIAQPVHAVPAALRSRPPAHSLPHPALGPHQADQMPLQ